MAQYTDNFHLAFFDFGDQLDDPINVQKEVNRWVMVDRQLYALSSVFGDGIITGWEVSEQSGLTIKISGGNGLIDKISIETEFPESLDLPSNSTIYIYAGIDAASLDTRSVSFSYSTTSLNDGEKLLLATVTTGSTNIEDIDNTVKTYSGFKQVIAEELANLRPTISLEDNVQGQLPMSRMEDIDASKIVGGRLPSKVLPQTDHSKLKNIGTLTHPQLDSIVKSIQKDNIELLGEIATVNLLKTIIYLKYLDNEADKYMVNELAIIPGISSENLIDWENTTANVDSNSHCISGIPETPFTATFQNDPDLPESTQNNFTINTITYDTTSDFSSSASSTTNLAIKNGIVQLSIDTTFNKIIDTFEGGIAENKISAYSGSLNTSDTVQVVYDKSAAEGVLSGRFEILSSKTAKFVKTFDQTQDWSNWDRLNIYVKNYGVSHSAVNLTLIDEDDNDLITYILLNANEDTTLTNPETSGFKLSTFDISTVENIDKIKKISITTDQIINTTEQFFIDTIYLSSEEHVMPQGNLRLRYNSVTPVIFSSIEYEANIPVGTDLLVRIRTANSVEELITATFSNLLNSGEVFNLTGKYIELDFTFVSDTNKTLTPKLDIVRINILSPSTTSGLTIDTAEKWNNGKTLNNIETNQDSSYISLKNTNIGNIYYTTNDQISEIDINYVPVLGIASQNLPISPAQAQNALKPPTTAEDPYGNLRRDTRGFYKARSAYRLNSGNYIIADTGNDRVIEIDQDGNFIRGFASHNYDLGSDSDGNYALTANYNSRLGILFITFNKEIDIQNFDLSTINIVIGTTSTIILSNDTEIIKTLTGESLPKRVAATDTGGPSSGRLDRAMAISLSSDKKDILDNTTDAVNVLINGNSSTLIECFMGDFMYFGQLGIHRPIYANAITPYNSSTSRFLIANSSVLADQDTLIGTSPIIEFRVDIGEFEDDSNSPIGLTFSYGLVYFSDIMLGSLQYYEEENNGVTMRKLIIAGLESNTNESSTSSSSSSSTSLPTIDDDKMGQFRGVVKILDMDSFLTSLHYVSPDGLYPSDAYKDSNGYILIAESGFNEGSGRIVKIDPSGIGDGQQPPVIELIEGGMFTKIWDIRELNNDHIFVST